MNNAINKLELSAFAFLGAVTIISLLAAFETGFSYFVLIPFALLVIYTGIVNFKILYFVLLAASPLYMEYSFSPTLGTDLPDEPLMIGLMFVTFGYLLSNRKALPTGYFTHFIIVALLAHVLWILISAIYSVNPLISLKVFLAKIWYVTTFSFLSAIVLKTKADIKKAFWCIYIPLTLTIVQVLIRHSLTGFAFEEINYQMWPFYRNHVNYASILSLFFPFILLARGWYKKGSFTRFLLTFSLLFYIVAIYFSYTRTAYLALLLIYPLYIVIQKKWMKPMLAGIAIVATILLINLFNRNNFLKYAPDFDTTIYHEDFGKHLSSTVEGKDLSSMERVYRWVAAVRMFKDHPWMGFGPGNFYPYYMHYTLSSFETYVSDNPERSTAHNYALFVLAEQGGVGLAIFLILTVVTLVYGEKIYHRMQDPDEKRITMTLLLVIMIVYINLMLSDMLESDKVGPFFFMSLSLLVAFDIRRKSALKPQGK